MNTYLINYSVILCFKLINSAKEKYSNSKNQDEVKQSLVYLKHLFKQCKTKTINANACEELVLRCQNMVDDANKKENDEDIFKPLLDLTQYLTKVNQDKIEKILEPDEDTNEKKGNANGHNSETEFMADADLTENGPSTSTVIEAPSLSDRDSKKMKSIKKLDNYLQVFRLLKKISIKINKMFFNFKKLNKKIIELENKELGLEDLDKEDSDYLLEDRLKKRWNKVD